MACKAAGGYAFRHGEWAPEWGTRSFCSHLGLLLAYGTVAFLSFVCAGEIVTTHLYCATAVEFLLLR
jgi:hypothetical protein